MILRRLFNVDTDNVLYYLDTNGNTWSIVEVDKDGYIQQFFTSIQTKDWPEKYRIPSRYYFEDSEIYNGKLANGLRGNWWTQFEGKHYSELIQSLCGGRCEL